MLSGTTRRAYSVRQRPNRSATQLGGSDNHLNTSISALRTGGRLFKVYVFGPPAFSLSNSYQRSNGTIRSGKMAQGTKDSTAPARNETPSRFNTSVFRPLVVVSRMSSGRQPNVPRVHPRGRFHLPRAPHFRAAKHEARKRRATSGPRRVLRGVRQPYPRWRQLELFGRLGNLAKRHFVPS